jgi:hypothetical protein
MVHGMTAPTRLDSIADRLQRDAHVAELFVKLGLQSQRTPRVAAVRAAKAYRQWCESTRSDLLNVNVDLPADIDALEQQWRLHAYASEIRAGSSAVSMLVLLMGVALLLGVLLALSGNYVAAATAAVVAAASYLGVKRAKPVLLVGPAAASLPFWLSPTSR